MKRSGWRAKCTMYKELNELAATFKKKKKRKIKAAALNGILVDMCKIP